MISLQWRHNEHGGVSNHQPLDCLLNRLFSHRPRETSKLRVTGLCEGNSPVTGEFPHKGPVTRKMFPFDGVIVYSDKISDTVWRIFHSDAQWRHWTLSTLLQGMSSYLMATSHNRTNVKIPSLGFCSFRLNAISQEIFNMTVTKLQKAYELNHWLPRAMTLISNVKSSMRLE